MDRRVACKKIIMIKETKVHGMELVIEAQQELIKGYENELRRLRLSNLKMKLHMQVLVKQPNSLAAEKICKQYVKADFGDSIIHFN